MLNESDRNLPLLSPTEVTMTDYLIAVRVFLLLEAKEHPKVRHILSADDKASLALKQPLPKQYLSAMAA